ncbi:UNVERIFIED_CONTAM: hypothetical protein Sradi_4024100 [Sesamum radiatum]|uniref:Uncharacterized protein n=1 Tax=Sesamum radiatum TaxID=300843 RepID=A0AAW2PHS2_SESRA
MALHQTDGIWNPPSSYDWHATSFAQQSPRKHITCVQARGKRQVPKNGIRGLLAGRISLPCRLAPSFSTKLAVNRTHFFMSSWKIFILLQRGSGDGSEVLLHPFLAM